MSEVGFAFSFDCPIKAYDLSLQSDWLTDEMKLEFDQWFESPHEELPKPPSDEEFFSKLLNPNQQQPKINNENKPNNSINNTTNSNLRKRSITEIHPSSTLSSLKASRNTPSSSSIASATSSSTRPTKIVRPNPTASSSSSTTTTISSSTLTKATQNSTLRTVTSKTTFSRAGSAPKVRPATSNYLTTAVPPAAPLRSTQQQQQKQHVVSNLRSTSAGKVRPTFTNTSKAANGKKSFTNDNNELESSLEQLLKAHNAKFVPVPAYEPPKHSVRDVRKWEKLTGNLWCELKPEERQAANDQITKMKESNEIV